MMSNEFMVVNDGFQDEKSYQIDVTYKHEVGCTLNSKTFEIYPLKVSVVDTENL